MIKQGSGVRGRGTRVQRRLTGRARNPGRPLCGRTGRFQARRGVSIIEMLIVVSVAAAIVGMGVTTIHLLLRAEREQTKSVWHAAALARVSEVLRRDVHAAHEAELAGARDRESWLRLTLPRGREVRYLVDAHALTRIETRAGAGITHRDAYHFPPTSTFRFVRDDELSLIRLEIEFAATPADLPRDALPNKRPARLLSIEATLDRDRRFEGREP